MAEIHVLDSETIDKIAAGEVVERPASVVKELVENAIDAGSTAITVEIKEGGIEFIRITDNGCGMKSSQVKTAFLRHATSKIENANDLLHISSLGFRGEALSSIAAVSKVEVITKMESSLIGIRYIIEGAVEQNLEEIGAPTGTTFIIRNLFYNTPVRRNFLKQPSTEGGYIADLLEHLAFSRPDISFKFINNNKMRFHTSGNGDLKEVIYRIYGREVAAQLVPIQHEENGISIEGYLGKPVLLRSNRSYEVYFINGRFIKSQVVAKAIEGGYKEYLMQHKFPLCVLHLKMDYNNIDVNVHPNKMDVRFSNIAVFEETLCSAIYNVLKMKEMIPEATLAVGKDKDIDGDTPQINKVTCKAPEPFEQVRTNQYKVMEEVRYEAEQHNMQDIMQNPVWNRVRAETSDNIAEVEETEDLDDFFTEQEPPQTVEEALVVSPTEASTQINFFEDMMLTVENRSKYRLLGQIFDTYWLLQFEDKLFIIDQHAAHEKVKYERLMIQYHNHEIISQTLMPPIIVSLTGREETVLKENMIVFENLGFEIEEFGGNEYALRSVPVDLYGCNERQMFLEVIDELSEGSLRNNLKVVEEKIASMSCKAAVKGNNTLSFDEANELIDELLTLENPYNCPHGRPTIISMSKMELEKKFKRIV